MLPHWTKAVNQQHPTVGTRFRPPRELHSPFYPLVGPYSSSDPATVRRQLLELKAAGVGVVAASWWGPSWRNGSTDSQGVSTDAALPLLLRVAEEVGVEVAFHLEPYPGRSAATTREDLAYLARRVRGRPAGQARHRSQLLSWPAPALAPASCCSADALPPRVPSLAPGRRLTGGAQVWAASRCIMCTTHTTYLPRTGPAC